jgi:hypothetical protein
MDIDEAIERRLEVFAGWRDCATWRNLAVVAGLDPNKRESYNEIVKAVNRIDRRRHEQGLCLLSPLVHSTRSRRPRRGIVVCLINLGLLTDAAFAMEVIEEQRERTWDDYAERDPFIELIAA